MQCILCTVSKLVEKVFENRNYVRIKNIFLGEKFPPKIEPKFWSNIDILVQKGNLLLKANLKVNQFEIIQFNSNYYKL